MVVQKNLDGWRWGETSVIQMFRANLPEKVQQEPQKVLGGGELGDGLCALCSWAGGAGPHPGWGGGWPCFFGDGDISLAPPRGHHGH